MSPPVAKVERFCFASRHLDGTPMIFGPHALTWVKLFLGVWFLAEMEKG